MKHCFICAYLLFASSNLYSRCDTLLKDKIEHTYINGQKVRILKVTSTGKQGITLIRTSRIKNGTITLGGFPLLIHEMRVSGAKKIYEVIRQAYRFRANDGAGPRLRKMQRKVERRLKKKVGLGRLAAKITSLNDYPVTCPYQSLSEYADYLAKTLR